MEMAEDYDRLCGRTSFQLGDGIRLQIENRSVATFDLQIGFIDNVEHRMGEKIRPEQVPGFNLPNLGDGGVGYRDALFVDRLYGSGCKEIVPFNGSNSGSL
jgi:hypothetical protein